MATADPDPCPFVFGCGGTTNNGGRNQQHQLDGRGHRLRNANPAVLVDSTASPEHTHTFPPRGPTCPRGQGLAWWTAGPQCSLAPGELLLWWQQKEARRNALARRLFVVCEPHRRLRLQSRTTAQCKCKKEWAFPATRRTIQMDNLGRSDSTGTFRSLRSWAGAVGSAGIIIRIARFLTNATAASKLEFSSPSPPVRRWLIKSYAVLANLPAAQAKNPAHAEALKVL